LGQIKQLQSKLEKDSSKWTPSQAQEYELESLKEQLWHGLTGICQYLYEEPQAATVLSFQMNSQDFFKGEA